MWRDTIGVKTAMLDQTPPSTELSSIDELNKSHRLFQKRVEVTITAIVTFVAITSFGLILSGTPDGNVLAAVNIVLICLKFAHDLLIY